MNGENLLAKAFEKYAKLKDELMKFGDFMSKNKLVKDGNGVSVEVPEDYLLWIYDIAVELSMLETAATEDEISPEQIESVRMFAENTGHESIIDVVQNLYGEQYAKISGNAERSFTWEDVVSARSSSVRRMVVSLKKTLKSKAQSFCEIFSAADYVNGKKIIDLLKECTTALLVTSAASDGSITVEEEDKLSTCFAISIVNDIEQRLSKMSVSKK